MNDTEGPEDKALAARVSESGPPVATTHPEVGGGVGPLLRGLVPFSLARRDCPSERSITERPVIPTRAEASFCLEVDNAVISTRCAWTRPPPLRRTMQRRARCNAHWGIRPVGSTDFLPSFGTNVARGITYGPKKRKL